MFWGKYSYTYTIFKKLFKDIPQMVSEKNKINSTSNQIEIILNNLMNTPS